MNPLLLKIYISKMLKPCLHYNVLGTARLIFWYVCRACFRHGKANSDSVNGAASATVPRFLAVTSTTKYVCLDTPIRRALPAFTQV